MASATVFLSVGAAATLVPSGSVEVLEAYGQIPDKNDPVSVLIRTRPGTPQADLLQQQTAGDLLIISGSLHLEESQPVITPSVICKAQPDQYLNDVVIVGNLAKPGRQAEKSCSRSLGVSRPIRKGDDWEEMTDWFILRGYGDANSTGTTIRDRLNNAPKGSLVQVSGCLSQRKSKDNEAYIEIKTRKLRVHKRGGGSVPDPAADKAGVVGYDHAEFTQPDDMPDNW